MALEIDGEEANIEQGIAWVTSKGVRVEIDCKSEQRILNVYIDKKFLSEQEDEKLFFISLSHILMQFLKRKYKKRFNNYYLIMHTGSFSESGKNKNQSRR